MVSSRDCFISTTETTVGTKGLRVFFAYFIFHISKKVIYNIGAKFLFLECFGHNSTWIAPFSEIIDDSGSSRRALSNPHVKTRLGAI